MRGYREAYGGISMPQFIVAKGHNIYLFISYRGPVKDHLVAFGCIELPLFCHRSLWQKATTLRYYREDYGAIILSQFIVAEVITETLQQRQP